MHRIRLVARGLRSTRPASISACVVVAAAVTACQTSNTPTPPSSSAAGSPSTAASTPAGAKTQVINVVAVIDGQPANGYRDVTAGEVSGTVEMCDASPSAVDPGIYRCSPSAAAADVCWKSTAQTLLCVDDPWRKQLHRVTVTDALPSVQPVSLPTPFALLLDNGMQCRLRNGGAWGGRDDGLVGAYGCNGEDVVLEATADGSMPIDRSQPLWTVKVGPLGAGDAHFPPPQTHSVATAWFAAALAT